MSMDESARVRTLLRVVHDLTQIDAGQVGRHDVIPTDADDSDPTGLDAADLGPVLQRTVDLAREVTGARYAALGVLADDDADRLSYFITSGISDAQRDEIGRAPRAHGLLGKVIRERKAVRVADLNADPDFGGFPQGHPPMHSFLGMPLRAGARVFGNLYLTDKAGGEPFGEEDEGVLEAVASVAGVVIDLTRRRQEVDFRRATGDSVRQINAFLLGGDDPAGALSMVTANAVRVSGARDALIVAAGLGEDFEVLAMSHSDGADAVPSRAPTVLHEVRDVLNRVRHGGVGEHRSQPTTVPLLRGQPGPPHTSVVPIPLRDDRQVFFIVAGWRCAPAASPALTEDFVASLAEQGGLVLDRIRAADNHDALMKVGDRERIAHDLHDLVIQRIFAAGLTLQAAARLDSSPQVRERVQRTIGELDATIQDIRATIFALSPVNKGASLRAQVRDLVRSYAPILGFMPAVRYCAVRDDQTRRAGDNTIDETVDLTSEAVMDHERDDDVDHERDHELDQAIDGALNRAIDDDSRVALLMVLREALSNVARHALARSVTIELIVETEAIVLMVTDDGVGLRAPVVESGLNNVRMRAQQRGGSMDLLANAPRGTVLRWQVPLRP